MIPIPKEQQQMLARGQNFGLIFSRMTSWDDAHGRVTKDNDAMNQMVRYADTALNDATKKLLETRHSEQRDYLKFVKRHGDCTLELEATLISPFVTGLGSGHVAETGFVLDRNLGVPYIRASSIKGVIRLAASIIEANSQDRIPDSKPVLKRFFGYTPSPKEQIDQSSPGEDDDTESSRGQIVFLDAYPKSCSNIIALDIMNPHFPGYYENSENRKWPAEDQDPRPIAFLAVKPGTIFVFQCYWEPMPGKCKDEVEKIHEYFRKGLEELGLGGKSSIGYGRFKVNEGPSAITNRELLPKPGSFPPKVPDMRQLDYLKKAEDEEARKAQQQEENKLKEQQKQEQKKREAQEQQKSELQEMIDSIKNAKNLQMLKPICDKFIMKSKDYRTTELLRSLKERIEQLGGPDKGTRNAYNFAKNKLNNK